MILDRISNRKAFYVASAAVVAVGTVAYGEVITSGAMLGLKDYSWYRIGVGITAFIIFFWASAELEANFAPLFGLFALVFAGLASSLLGAGVATYSLGVVAKTGDWNAAHKMMQQIPTLIDGGMLTAGWWNYLIALGLLIFPLVRDSIIAGQVRRARRTA